MVKTIFTVTQTTDNVEINNITNGQYDEPRIQADDVPGFQFEVKSRSGIEMYKLANGKEVQIKRAGVPSFPGIIETVEGKEGGNESTTVKATGIHKGYHLMRSVQCTSYDFDEDADPKTTRDAVTVNPWETIVFRKIGGTLDVRGNPPAYDGVTFDDAVRMVVGSRFIWQDDFQDNRYLLASGVYSTSNAVQVFRDGPTSDLRPKLQRVRDGTGFKAGGLVQSIPLFNGDRNVKEMGDISAVSVILIGELDGSSHPTIRVCRNAINTNLTNNASRTYTSITLTPTSNYLSSGLTAWTGTVSLSGSETVKNALGYELTIPGTGASSGTTKIHYIKLTATTTPDTGLTVGTIATYSNPVTIGGEENWVATDLQGFNRLEAIERIRGLTESSTATNTSPHWDFWIDGNLQAQFKERRGSAINKTYSFSQGNLQELSHEYYGGEIAYQTIAYGAGSGIAQNRIVSKQAFTSGGLYDSTRDPSSGALYGNLARVLNFVDNNEASAVALLRKARAFHKLHRDPIENIKINVNAEHIKYFETGDSITVSNLKTRTNSSLRVVGVTRRWSGDRREEVIVDLGEPMQDFSSHLSDTASDVEVQTIRQQPQESATGLAGNGVYFDKDHYGVYSFGVQDGSNIKRIGLKMTTQPWQATAKSLSASFLDDALISTDDETTTSLGNNASVNHDYTIPGSGYAAYRVVVLALLANSGNHFISVSNQTNGQVYFANSSTLYSGAVALELNDISGDTFRVSITNLSGAASDATSTVAFYGISPAATPLSFGIFQFDGDSGDGTGNPIYGKDITFAVDPTISAQGLPTTFSTQRHPGKFGSQTAPVTQEFDVTGYLSTESNGVIKNGEHRIYLIGAADGSTNANGLSVVSITPIVEYKT